MGLGTVTGIMGLYTLLKLLETRVIYEVQRKTNLRLCGIEILVLLP